MSLHPDPRLFECIAVLWLILQGKYGSRHRNWSLANMSSPFCHLALSINKSRNVNIRVQFKKMSEATHEVRLVRSGHFSRMTNFRLTLSLVKVFPTSSSCVRQAQIELAKICPTRIPSRCFNSSKRNISRTSLEIFGRDESNANARTITNRCRRQKGSC